MTEGALVSQPEGTLMTRIEQVSPIYVSFSQSATEVLQIRRAIAAGELQQILIQSVLGLICKGVHWIWGLLGFFEKLR